MLHLAVILFIVGGLLLIPAGNRLGWLWVNMFWFRLTHLAAIAVVVVQAWLGRYCGLTVLESWLREQAGEAGYRGSFVQHWVQRLIYHEAELWVFGLAYTVFGALVVLAWWRYPPHRSR